MSHLQPDDFSGGGTELLVPANTFNPQIARFYATLAARALDNRIDAGLPPLPAPVAAYLFPDAALTERAGKPLAAFRMVAGPLLQHAPKGRSEALLAGRPLFLDQLHHPGGSGGGDGGLLQGGWGAGAPAASAAAGAAAAAPAAAGGGLGGRKRARQEGDAAAVDDDDDVARLEATKRALVAGLHAAGGSGGGGGGGAGSEPSTGSIGTVDPVGDFHRMLARQGADVVETAQRSLARVIRTLARDSLGHDKALHALHALRAVALANYGEAHFNALLGGLMATATGADAAAARPPPGDDAGGGASRGAVGRVLAAACGAASSSSSSSSVGLITRADSPISDVTPAQAAAFAAQARALGGGGGAGAAAPAAEAEDDDDAGGFDPNG